MPIEDHFDPMTAVRMNEELARFAGICHYDEEQKKIIYHNDKLAMETYLALQREEMERHKWLESEKSCHDVGNKAVADWVNKYSAQFSRYWRRTHAYIPAKRNKETSPAAKTA
jgi:hypothetical protein